MSRFYTRLLLLSALLLPALGAFGQDYRETLQRYLAEQSGRYGFAPEDLSFQVTDQYLTRQTGITHVYIQQTHRGIPVFGAISSVALRDGQVISYANRLHAGLKGLVNAVNPTQTPEQAVVSAAAHLGKQPMGLALVSSKPEANRYSFNEGGIARQSIEVELMLVPAGDEIRLAWNVNVRLLESQDWWNVRVDALTGEFLSKDNWTLHCNHDQHSAEGHVHTAACRGNRFMERFEQLVAQDQHPEAQMSGSYRVYALPVESPNHGVRSLVSQPHNPASSPFGWHDNNGANGAEFTITRGNNVYAYDDQAAADQPGYSPDGGATLNFDYPLNLFQQPDTYLDAAITNLFYMNNMVHDILYVHGFDESAGNFQDNNYGNGGQGTDYVLAEAQDGGGTNNANFQTPPDGNNGIMQMYIWSGTGAGSTVTVNSPGAVAGNYNVSGAAFGPGVNSPITGNVVLGTDGTAPVNDCCEPITNGAALSGNIAMIDRGTCTFAAKTLAAQNEGAIAVVICNNVAGATINMGGTDPNIVIPAVMMTQADCNLLKAQLNNGTPVNMTLNPSANVDIDGDLDNGVVSHEYGHGLSIRLTGGPGNSSCLNGDEQMGEGWSDWLALILTIEPGDVGTDVRGMGTYASGQPTTGTGIRTYPYSTDMSVNPHTYADIVNESIPHGVGSVWCAAIWDLTWALIDLHGFDPDWYNGSGGNHIAMNLIVDAMKLQPCGPGFIDGRDAILQSDQNLYGGQHQCLIWEVFARRGVGFSADQGSSGTVGDETEAFDTPPFCQTPTAAPTAAFTVDAATNCFGVFAFTDQSQDIPQSWAWNFGDGNTSTLQNPTHTYSQPGTYTVTLSVTNILGSDSYNFTVNYTTYGAPTVTGDLDLCAGQSTTLSAGVLGGATAEWIQNGNVVGTGTSFATPTLNATTTYQVRQLDNNPIENVGSTQSNAQGGLHNTGFTGKLLFTTFAPMTLVSVEVNAGNAGPRDISLFDANGNVLQTVTINVPQGVSRATLNLDIVTPGDYQIGGTTINLWRNNAGAQYPYTVPGLVSITASNATQNPATFYYYLYDWEVREIPCESPLSSVTVNVVPGPTAAFAVSGTEPTYNFTDQSTGNPTSWAWNFGDGNSATGQNPTHTYSQAGTYTVTLTVTDANGCTNTTTQQVSILLGLEVPSAAFSAELFPNPTNGNTGLFLRGELRGSLIVDLLAVDGRLVRQTIVEPAGDAQEIRLQTEGLPSGTYLVRVQNAGGTLVKRLSVQR
jgi:PKD repeat protein